MQRGKKKDCHGDYSIYKGRNIPNSRPELNRLQIGRKDRYTGPDEQLKDNDRVKGKKYFFKVNTIKLEESSIIHLANTENINLCRAQPTVIPLPRPPVIPAGIVSQKIEPHHLSFHYHYHLCPAASFKYS